MVELFWIPLGLGELRVFRYEIYRRRNGVIPDADHAAATTTLQLDPPGWDAGLVIASRPTP